MTTRRVTPAMLVRLTRSLEEAACTRFDPLVFFPPEVENSTAVEAARAVCRSCAVQSECLAHALEVGEEAGVWGGTTPGERVYLQRLRRRTSRVDAAG